LLTYCIELLDERGIPHLDLSPVELARDVAAAMAAARRPEGK
jgi:hypothetical protein